MAEDSAINEIGSEEAFRNLEQQRTTESIATSTMMDEVTKERESALPDTGNSRGGERPSSPTYLDFPSPY